MITKIVGDMLEEANHGFLVHGCNAQGAMNRGIASSIRTKWPEVYNEYHAEYLRCCNIFAPSDAANDAHVYELEMGSIIPVLVDPDVVVVNAITQQYYTGHKHSTGGREVDYEAVTKCFEQINMLPMLYPNIGGILHFPLIGAGLAKGDWDIISNIIDKTVTSMEKVLWVLPTN